MRDSSESVSSVSGQTYAVFPVIKVVDRVISELIDLHKVMPQNNVEISGLISNILGKVMATLEKIAEDELSACLAGKLGCDTELLNLMVREKAANLLDEVLMFFNIQEKTQYTNA